MTITIIILSLLLILLIILLRNLIIKVGKYEVIIKDQVNYLQEVSKIIQESQKHLKDLDEREVFKSDDEVGHFFEQMIKIQENLNTYMLPKNYGKNE